MSRSLVRPILVTLPFLSFVLAGAQTVAPKDQTVHVRLNLRSIDGKVVRDFEAKRLSIKSLLRTVPFRVMTATNSAQASPLPATVAVLVSLPQHPDPAHPAHSKVSLPESLQHARVAYFVEQAPGKFILADGSGLVRADALQKQPALTLQMIADGLNAAPGAPSLVYVAGIDGVLPTELVKLGVDLGLPIYRVAEKLQTLYGSGQTKTAVPRIYQGDPLYGGGPGISAALPFISFAKPNEVRGSAGDFHDLKDALDQVGKDQAGYYELEITLPAEAQELRLEFARGSDYTVSADQLRETGEPRVHLIIGKSAH